MRIYTVYGRDNRYRSVVAITRATTRTADSDRSFPWYARAGRVRYDTVSACVCACVYTCVFRECVCERRARIVVRESARTTILIHNDVLLWRLVRRRQCLTIKKDKNKKQKKMFLYIYIYKKTNLSGYCATARNVLRPRLKNIKRLSVRNRAATRQWTRETAAAHERISTRNLVGATVFFFYKTWVSKSI